ncbi:matrix metalloproteinase-26 [Macrotis lagotis]|uniref:matrix metalloproteinase-26 n=1 Tax=Macrotis lagotis TaxID=92651 RepID=UPI003D68D2D0
MLSTLLLLTFFLPCCLSIPIVSSDVLDDLNFFKDYFQRFFFIKESQDYTVEDQLRFLQHFFKLEETGLLDEPTRAFIRQPRCGIRDTADYSLFPGRPIITNNPITYSLINYPEGMKKRTVDEVLQKATQVWSSVTPLEFQRVYSLESDIEFAFLAGEHGDGYPFDGEGNILAHAFAPNPDYQGAVHFDSDERWSYTNRGINLFLVAVHELGHALGLEHSQDPDSIMFPNYQYQDPKFFQLSNDDIRGIQKLYH